MREIKYVWMFDDLKVSDHEDSQTLDFMCTSIVTFIHMCMFEGGFARNFKFGIIDSLAGYIYELPVFDEQLSIVCFGATRIRVS